ncbi:MAG TPA: hypothetical protein VMT87_02750, partial [Vicinamibacteria bacterium]|nr:hypothetical protein [Vicinamibacteria bacterium]
MRRRRFLKGGAAAAAVFDAPPASVPGDASKWRLTPPLRGRIPVAFVLGPGATMIDFAGPWEVFQDVMVPERGPSHEEQMPFALFTVAEKAATLRVTGGMQVTPDSTVENAPPPRVIVIPAHQGSPKLVEWVRTASAT